MAASRSKLVPRSAGARLSVAALLGAVLVASPARAEDDAADIAFWTSVRGTRDARELDAYVAAFPTGHFVELARLRAVQLRGGQAQPAAPAGDVVPAAVSGASVRPAKRQVRLIDGVLVDVDATALRGSSNIRLAIVPAGTPDAVTDSSAFAEMSTSIQPGRLHLTLPGGPAGADEVRLYYIPPSGDAFRVAARAPVQVAPGVPGAALVRDLAREARQLGPLRFEANHRDQPMLVQAQFLRVRPETDFDTRWLAALGLVTVPRQVAVVNIGMLGQGADSQAAGEATCVLAIDDSGTLSRVAALRPGEAVLLRGVPTSWSSAGPEDPILLKDCTFAD